MEFCLCSFQTTNPLDDKFVNDTLLKDAAFNARRTIDGKKNSVMSYEYILIPLEKLSESENESYGKERDHIKSLITTKSDATDEIVEAILKFLSSKGSVHEVSRLKISIKVNSKRILLDSCGISYCDGSFRKSDSTASYGVCRLLEESQTGGLDSFSGETRNYQKLSGQIKNGTNNIGELTGMKVVIENFGDENVQLIISDSQYSIKSFREWIWNWKANGYRAYNGKTILNKDLIQNIAELVESSNKIILYKWTKGHDSDFFNNVCDELAKKALGLK